MDVIRLGSSVTRDTCALLYSYFSYTHIAWAHVLAESGLNLRTRAMLGGLRIAHRGIG